MSSSSNKSCYSGTARSKRISNFCSTPVQDAKVHLPSSISVSAVEINSSSSAAAIPSLSKQKTIAKDLRQTRGKKRQKRGTNLRRKKRFRAVITSDSDWETKSERSVEEELNSAKSNQQAASVPDYSVLFKDTYGSPERVREALYLENDDRLESPLFRPRQGGMKILGKINLFRGDILPLEDLSSLRTRVHDDDEEDTKKELGLKRINTDRTYPNKGHVKRFNIDMKIKKEEFSKELLGSVSYPTATANLLWDNFVKDNYEKVKKYLAPE